MLSGMKTTRKRKLTSWGASSARRALGLRREVVLIKQSTEGSLVVPRDDNPEVQCSLLQVVPLSLCRATCLRDSEGCCGLEGAGLGLWKPISLFPLASLTAWSASRIFSRGWITLVIFNNGESTSPKVSFHSFFRIRGSSLSAWIQATLVTSFLFPHLK